MASHHMRNGNPGALSPANTDGGDPIHQGRPSRSSRTIAGRRSKVLLADYSKTFLFVGRSILHRAPVDVITATDGMEVLAKAQAERPDLILMDVNMPMIDGLEATRRLRLLEDFRETPILLVSSQADAVHRHAALASGGTEFIVKPVDAATLLATILDHLSR
jgi:CheY-like chemotaxis protein